MTRVLIATADTALRNALKLILCQRLPIMVVGEPATRGGLTLALTELQPDLLLVDWALPEFREAGNLPAYQALAPGMHVVALSVAVEDIAGVLAAGAHACLAHGASPDNLLGLLRPFV